MNLVIQAFGEQEMSRKLLRFAVAAEDMLPAFAEIRQSFFDVERKQFETQGGFSGGWAPLADSTVAEKSRLGIDPRIMYGATGDLMTSLTSSGNGSLYDVTPDSVTIGSDIAYGVYHQSREPRTKLPRRPLVELDEGTKVEWVKILQRHIVGAAHA